MKWKKVFSSQKIHEIILVEQLLETNNIQSVRMNKQDSAYLFGQIEIFVSQEDALVSSNLIQNKLSLE